MLVVAGDRRAVIDLWRVDKMSASTAFRSVDDDPRLVDDASRCLQTSSSVEKGGKATCNKSKLVNSLVWVGTQP